MKLNSQSDIFASFFFAIQLSIISLWIRKHVFLALKHRLKAKKLKKKLIKTDFILDFLFLTENASFEAKNQIQKGSFEK